MKRLYSLLLCLILIVSLSSMVFAKTDKPSEAEESLRSAYMNDSEFHAHLAADPKDAMDALDNAINNLGVIDPADEKKYIEMINASVGTVGTLGLMPMFWDNYNYAWVNTSLVQQINGYYCGPASVLMAIWGWGGNVSGSTNTAKQNTLASAMGTTSSSGTYVYRVRDTLNSYLGSNFYSYYLGSSLDQTTFRVYVFNSLSKNRAPILHAKTEYLSYYNGHASGHYITATDFNYDNMTIRLHDCNNNSSYYGVRSVAWQQVYNSIYASGRYLIVNW